jgi:hypothetical protein
MGSIGQDFQSQPGSYTNIGWFIIIVGVSVAYNFQTRNNKIKLLTEYESVTQNVLIL